MPSTAIDVMPVVLCICFIWLVVWNKPWAQHLPAGAAVRADRWGFRYAWLPWIRSWTLGGSMLEVLLVWWLTWWLSIRVMKDIWWSSVTPMDGCMSVGWCVGFGPSRCHWMLRWWSSFRCRCWRFAKLPKWRTTRCTRGLFFHSSLMRFLVSEG